MSMSLLAITLGIYLSFLFWLANFGDKNQFKINSWTKHPWVYALSLGVYCTSWTFFGLVGTAAHRGWAFLPILLGPILLFLFAQPLLSRIAFLCQQENIRSIADFFAARYGKRRGVATGVTFIVFIATVPYIALQLKAVGDTVGVISGGDNFSSVEISVFTAVAMMVFALVFGVRRLEASGYHAGLMTAVAFESVVKLLALVAMCVFSIALLRSDATVDIAQVASSYSLPSFGLRFWSETALSACAILCLPRMFHVVFVEHLSQQHLRVARWVFPAYLSLIAVAIIAISLAGNHVFAGQDISADNYVLLLPMAKNQSALTLLVVLGGISAATAMIIVATVTLSHMLTNDVILPLLIKNNVRNGGRKVDYSRALILARRFTVVLVILLAYLYQRVFAGHVALTDIGLIAFTLVAQLAPALLLGLYLRGGKAQGAYAALCAGCAVVIFTLIVPLLVDARILPETLLRDGLWSVSWLRPEHLFNFTFADAFTRGVLLSLCANVAAYYLFSSLSRSTLADRIQARAFVTLARAEPPSEAHEAYELEDLRALLVQFLGESVTEQMVARHKQGDKPMSVSPALSDAAEHALAGVVGVASARALLSALASGKRIAVEDVVHIFEETNKALRFNQDMIAASFESISSAISVANDDLKLVCWNRRYEEMFDYPPGMLEVGVAVADLVRFNSGRGMLGAGSAEEHVQRRLNHMQGGKPYRVVRNHGKNVIEIKGSPLPGGGYVTTYDDISEFIAAQDKLEKNNMNLEQRVKERTTELEVAQRVAESANRSKSRFLALASHDILQPLNAANLYVNILLEQSRNVKGANTETIEHLHQAIESSESIISTLLEVSKLDTGALQVELAEVTVDSMLATLVHEFRVQLAPTVELHYVPSNLGVRSDPRYLRRIVQNFLSNAVKYTAKGKILVGCRRRGVEVEICVVDTGPGIHESQLERIFEDFYRANTQQSIAGLGLGLGVASRFSNLLGHRIHAVSKLGQGSSFSVFVPRVAGSVYHPASVVDEAALGIDGLVGKRVFYLDDDAQNTQAMKALLDGWQCHATVAGSTEGAREYARKHKSAPAELMIIDWQLDHEHDGISVAKSLHEIWSKNVPTCIVSASPEPELATLVASHGFEFLKKPIKPGKLRAILEQMLTRADT